MTFGEKLQKLRKSRNMTQFDLANAINASQNTVSQYESGARNPSFEAMQVIAKYFGVPVSSLMPSDAFDNELVQQVADSLHQNPKLGLLFDKARFMTEKDLDAVLAVVNAISKERDPDD